METPPVGSLVVPAPAYRETMGTGEGAALLIALNRGSGHLYYPGTDRSFWVPMRQVRAIPSEAVPDDSLEHLLSELLLFVDADDCGIDEVGAGSMTLALEIPGMTRSKLQELEDRLGAQLAGLSFDPGSMRAVLLRLELVSLPDPSGAGR